MKMPEETKLIAVVRVRGVINIKSDIKDTLEMLGLQRKNHCVVLKSTPSALGMIRKAKDYITWGEIDQETYDSLVSKRGQEFKGRTEDSKGKIKYNKYVEIAGKKYKKYFRLNPPKKGYGVSGIKKPFKVKGGLGYRGKEIRDLLLRMM